MNARTALVTATLTLALVVPTAAGAGSLKSPAHQSGQSKHAVSHQTSKQRQAAAKAKAAKLRAAKARAAKARALKTQRAGRPLLIWVATANGPSTTNESLDPCETYRVDCPEVSSSSTQESTPVEASSDEQTSAPTLDESQTSDESSTDSSAADSSSASSWIDTSAADYSDC